MSSNPILAGSATLADYTSEELIIPVLRETDTAGVIQELTQRLHKQSRVPDVLPFYHAALNREFLVSTAMEYGLSFPHARLSGLPALCYAFGRCAQPMVWGPQAAKRVEFVFLLAVPTNEATTYLYLVSGLARLGKDAGLMARLRSSSNAEEIMETLRQVKVGQLRNAAP